MTLEDRERNFEKALGRELKANGVDGLDCPDAETLAAYHDRMLSPEEMAAHKTHIAACPRCQEILATLEVTEAIPSGAEDSEKAYERPAVLPLGNAIEVIRGNAESASVREMPKRKVYVRWAVPAGAIAAGLLVWIAMNTGRSPKTITATVPVQIAENREQKEAPLSTAKPDLKTPASSSMSDKVALDERMTAKQESEAFATGDLAKTQSETQDKTMARGRAALNYSHGPRQLQNQANQTQNNGQIVAQNQATEFDKLSEVPLTGRNSTALEQNAPRPNEQTMKATPAAPPPAAGAGAAAGKPVEADARKDKDLEVQSMAQTVEVTGADASIAADDKSAALKKSKAAPRLGMVAGANLRDISAGGPGLIQSPDPKVFWLFTASGVVFKTEDGGKTTHEQKVGDGMKLLAGSAPDAKTCWLLAQGHLVLRTVDGGEHWLKVSIPSGAGFSTIVATDGLHASISDPLFGLKLATADGGATWRLVEPK